MHCQLENRLSKPLPGMVEQGYQPSDTGLGPSELGIRFNITPATVARHCIDSGLELLSPQGVEEVMGLPGGAVMTLEGGVSCLAGQDLALLAIQVDESAHGGIERAAHYAYQKVLKGAQGLGFAHLVRVWNYLADINGEERGLERYRGFCVGRFQAFAEQGVADADFPAACALGHAGGALVVYLLAARTAPRHFENPQQVSAYRYPSSYGPRSPSFARATLLTQAGFRKQLFVSGTASVVGYRTCHVGDIDGQLRVTFENLERLLTHVQQQAQLESALLPEVLKVYVRHREQAARIRRAVEQQFGEVPAVYVQADICREDLLVEIDGIWGQL